jgi:hypothetical protein
MRSREIDAMVKNLRVKFKNSNNIAKAYNSLLVS